MTFISLSFLVFITFTALLYFIIPLKNRWIVLLIASYVFYWLNSRWLLLVHLGTTMATFCTGLWMDKLLSDEKRFLTEKGSELTKEQKKAIRDQSKRKTQVVLWLGIGIDLSLLFFLKYWNFFAGSVNPLSSRFGLTIPKLNLLLPLGISFYTLQAIAYLIDTSRGKIKADRNPLKFMLFMSFFPQIVQGPIARYNKLAKQLYVGHSWDYDRVTKGIQLMLWGWFKKLVIADRAMEAVKNVFDNPGQYHGGIIFFAAALYSIQIYTDFSGGMDVCRGVAQVLGIDLELNFLQPFFSRSIEEFWRRWHITLGNWMRDYVFYPLSLSKTFTSLGRKARKILGSSFGKKLPAFLSMFIVYLLVGLWHGARWQYIAYGIWNGMFIMSGILFADTYEKLRKLCSIREDAFIWRLFQMVRTFVICTFGRYFVRATGLKYALYFFRDTFRDFGDISFLVDGSFLELGLKDTANWVLLAAAVLILIFVDLLHEKGYQIRDLIARRPLIFRWIFYIVAILSILIFGIYGPTYDPSVFIYGQF